MNPGIIFHDDTIIVVDKPAGMLAVPGKGPDKQDCVATRMLAIDAAVKIVHRLDCHTSGIMLLALGLEAQRELSRQFHDREVEKTYLAMVHGRVEDDAGVARIPLRGDPDNRPRQVVDHVHGKPAETHWRVLRRYTDATRLSLKPVTGRTHQLRVHCSAMGYPIIGDSLYAERLPRGRMMLHAETIIFTHPRTGQRMHLSAACEF